ncbi:hypothetical protein EV122DRAFT_278595 [Schizophyllum commune]
MSSSTALLELANNKAIITRLLEKEIATDYSYRGAIFKRPSPIDFAPKDSRPGLAEQAELYGRVAMKAALQRAIDMSPELKVMSAVIHEALIDIFSSANIMRLEAASHHPYPNMPSNEETSLNAIIASCDDPTVLDRWVSANLKHTMEDVSRTPSVRESLLSAFDPSTGRLAAAFGKRDEEKTSKKRKREQGDSLSASQARRQSRMPKRP